MDKSKFQVFRHYTLDSGDMDEFIATRDGALVGASIAKRKGWGTGDTIDLRDQLGLLMVVKGVFQSGNEDQDNTVLADITYVQDQYNARGDANTIMLKLDPDADADALAQQIDEMSGDWPTGTSTQAEKAFVRDMIEDLGDMVALSRIVILITLMVVFISVANTVSMSVRDRTQQIGMMRTLGFRRWMVTLLVVGESALVCLIGGIFGALVAYLLIHFQGVTIQSRTLNLEVSMPWTVIALALGLSALIGAIGSIWPALRAGRMNIVEAVGSVG